ncbi:MAG: hypothetical protein AVDCRST_MAG34-1630 [uncultured Nocardioidaceae bacterium]|uniref:Uncharacterized protein n=1 Tax=uncultured Nocardioidaceae bacterium TaxID=253824 RepID=A0A6J4M5V3_9ACTN|nr:MAG: hypothetical protein AVDCRST_MAG34-1630 [uncultured Nocardioidaceae bacterium]
MRPTRASLPAGVRAVVRDAVVAVVAVTAVVLVGAAAGCASSLPVMPSPGDSAAVGPGQSVAPAERTRRARVVAASELLHRWDARRSAAYAQGDVAALRRLYTPTSSAGESDVAMLQRYVGRGLVVRRMQTQVLDLRLDRWTPHCLVLVVRDRLMGAVARAAHGRPVRRALPADRADRWRLTLLPADGHWLMARVAAR